MQSGRCSHSSENKPIAERLLIETQCVLCRVLCCRFCTHFKVSAFAGLCKDCRSQVANLEPAAQVRWLCRVLQASHRSNISGRPFSHITRGGYSFDPQQAPQEPNILGLDFSDSSQFPEAESPPSDIIVGYPEDPPNLQEPPSSPDSLPYAYPDTWADTYQPY